MNVYDFDKTIYKHDSTADFFIYSIFRHPRILCLIPSIIAGFVRFYILKKGTKTEFKTKIMRFVKHIDFEKDINDFWDKKIKYIKDFYYKTQRDDDVIISASPRFILEPVCKMLKINNLICSEVDSETGCFLRENCHGKEKVKRFREIYKDAKIDEFYSDSFSDTPLAEISQKAYMVKGEKLTPWIFK